MRTQNVRDSLFISDSILKAVHHKSPSKRLTYDFYKYPARFSPEFVRAVILSFTEKGDLVLDPFMGSGTVLVEALLAGRNAIGSDINPLAHFVAQTKLTFLTKYDSDEVKNWLTLIIPRLNLRRKPIRDYLWAKAGYQKDLPWPIRKTIELILSELTGLKNENQRQVIRCALLSAAQIALDCRKSFPTAEELRIEFSSTVMRLLASLTELETNANAMAHPNAPIAVCLNKSAQNLFFDNWSNKVNKKVSLIITSPPYPGVHVLYHRWQIRGRRETAAPFWIIGREDGAGASHYTMGSRTPTGLNNYFTTIRESFKNLRKSLEDRAIVVQLIAFADPETQLPRYLNAMNLAGYREMTLKSKKLKSNERIWRQVPLRRWYASLQGKTSSSRELLLIHRKQ